MEIIFWSAVLGGALFTLIKSADFFTNGAEKIGLYFGLSSFIIGATIISIGSSMPEIMTSVIGVLDGKVDFPVDNIIGSNIANILLIGGISGVFALTRLNVHKELINIDLPFFFLSTFTFLYFISDGIYTWREGVASLLMLLIFIGYTLSVKPETLIEKPAGEKKIGIKPIIYIIGGVIGIYFGAEYTITSVYKLSEILSIPSAVVTIFAVAIGTSLPELVISIQAVRKENYDIALGNIFGSNTFNALAVAGIPSLFAQLTVSPTSLSIGLPFLAIATVAFIFSTMDNKVEKWEAIALLFFYIIFIGKIIGFL